MNPGPLILEVTALQTKQQTLYLKQVYCFAIFDCFSQLLSSDKREIHRHVCNPHTCSSCLLPELQSVWLSCVMSTVIHDYVCSCLLACSIVVAYCCHWAQVERITKVGMERDGIHASEKEHVHAAMARIRMVRLSLPLFIIFVMHLPPPSSGH